MNKTHEDIKVIRDMMEKSSKFLSFSGLSGIIAGIIAVAGAAFAYFYLLRDPSLTDFNHKQEIGILLADALAVLILSIGVCLWLSYRKAHKRHQKLWNSAARRALYNLSIPLIAGGIFSLVFLLRGNIQIVASATLIFYGLALVNASKYTFEEIHYLGITEIILGLLAAVTMCYGILFWTLGFGLCHIVYGLAMYYKYDRKK